MAELCNPLSEGLSWRVYEPLTEKEYPSVSFFSLGALINGAQRLLSYLSYD
jgi:hypothetical protein